MITTKHVAAGIAGVLGATSIALASPALAEATTVPVVTATATADSETSTSDAERRQSFIERVKQALSGLVSDGTISDEQADAVASTLAERAAERGGPGHGRHGGDVGRGEVMAAAAQTLGLSENELRDKLGSATLGEIADGADVSRDALVDAMVAAATEQINQAVSDGNLSQERADEMLGDLETRITERLDQSRGERGGHGMRPGMGSGTGSGGSATPSPTSTS